MSSYGRWFDLQVCLGVLAVRALGATLRVRWYHGERVVAARGSARDGVLYAFWHQRLLPFCYTHRFQGVHVMVSTHRDGELITRIIGRLGFGAVRGSSTRQGMKALFGMAAEGRRGVDLAVTPDGPRGPREVLKPGMVVLARRLGKPIVPIANAAWPRIELRSWDRFHVPLPGARCAVVVGEPWLPVDTASVEDSRRDLEHRLQMTTAEADRLCRA
ncbi:lysophospholipid acyltransferase family protein [Candidatus Fermentibacteria bacterium]|nr:lysophospholipid acyltransferase family protein [Candidatus Fermentibacteria bacterium]